CHSWFLLPPIYPNRFFVLIATPPPHIYTLSLHDALPISLVQANRAITGVDRERLASAIHLATNLGPFERAFHGHRDAQADVPIRSEEHTSELQSPDHLVCRLLLEKKKNISRKDLLH